MILLLAFLGIVFLKKNKLPEALENFNPDLLVLKLFEKMSETMNKNALELVEKFGSLETKLSENMGQLSLKSANSLSDFQTKLRELLVNDFRQIRLLMDEKLKEINEKVNENITTNFKKTDETFQKIIERITKIDEAQKKMEELSKNVISLQNVLTDKKARGAFGEVQLQQILTSVFGEKNDDLFKEQFSLPNNTRVDAVILFPEPTGMVCVDSKFPLENYQRMLEAKTEEEKKNLSKIFSQNLKKHIDDISSKYIIKGITAENAILFLPAEAIFAEIHGYHPDIVDYAHKKKVLITSPTTLLAVCNMVQVSIQQLEIKRNAQSIYEELESLSKEFSRYQGRWRSLSNSIERVYKDTKEVEITSGKIIKRFDEISSGRPKIEAASSTRIEDDVLEEIWEEKDQQNLL